MSDSAMTAQQLLERLNPAKGWITNQFTPVQDVFFENSMCNPGRTLISAS